MLEARNSLFVDICNAYMNRHTVGRFRFDAEVIIEILEEAKKPKKDKKMSKAAPGLARLALDMIKLEQSLFKGSETALDDGIIDSFLEEKHEILKIEYAKVHAEMRVISRVLKNEKDKEKNKSQPKYIGISRLCCPNCSLAIMAVNQANKLNVVEMVLEEGASDDDEVKEINSIQKLFEIRGQHGVESNWEEPSFLEGDILLIYNGLIEEYNNELKKVKQLSEKVSELPSDSISDPEFSPLSSPKKSQPKLMPPLSFLHLTAENLFSQLKTKIASEVMSNNEIDYFSEALAILSSQLRYKKQININIQNVLNQFNPKGFSTSLLESLEGFNIYAIEKPIENQQVRLVNILNTHRDELFKIKYDDQQTLFDAFVKNPNTEPLELQDDALVKIKSLIYYIDNPSTISVSSEKHKQRFYTPDIHAKRNAFNQYYEQKYWYQTTDINAVGKQLIESVGEENISGFTNALGKGIGELSIFTFAQNYQDTFVNPTEIKPMVGIYNIGNRHWVAFSIIPQLDENNEVTSLEVLYKDSYGGESPNSTFKQEMENSFPDFDIKIILTDTKNQQLGDGSSCGLFALKNMQHMAHGITKDDNGKFIYNDIKVYDPAEERGTRSEGIKELRRDFAVIYAEQCLIDTEVSLRKVRNKQALAAWLTDGKKDDVATLHDKLKNQTKVIENIEVRLAGPEQRDLGEYTYAIKFKKNVIEQDIKSLLDALNIKDRPDYFILDEKQNMLWISPKAIEKVENIKLLKIDDIEIDLEQKEVEQEFIKALNIKELPDKELSAEVTRKTGVLLYNQEDIKKALEMLFENNNLKDQFNQIYIDNRNIDSQIIVLTVLISENKENLKSITVGESNSTLFDMLAEEVFGEIAAKSNALSIIKASLPDLQQQSQSQLKELQKIGGKIEEATIATLEDALNSIITREDHSKPIVLYIKDAILENSEIALIIYRNESNNMQVTYISHHDAHVKKVEKIVNDTGYFGTVKALKVSESSTLDQVIANKLSDIVSELENKGKATSPGINEYDLLSAIQFANVSPTVSFSPNSSSSDESSKKDKARSF